MSRVMLIARAFPPFIGGIDNFMYNVYSRLSGDIVVVALFERGCSAFDRDENISIHRTLRVLNFLNKGKMALLPLFLSAVRVLLTHKIDQIHCDQTQSGVIGFFFKKFFSIPYVVYAHGMEITGGGGHRFKSIVLRNANIVIANSNFTRRVLNCSMNVESSKIVVVNPPVDTAKFKPGIGCDDVIMKYRLNGKKVILTVGRLSDKEKYKGQDAVIKALPKVSTRIPDVIYLIVGRGDDMERLKALVHDLGLEKKVIFAGYVPDEDLLQYYNACDLFIMPSREKMEEDGKGKKVEGFGIVFLEANACGKPVIGGRSGGIEDAVIDGVTGLLIDPENVDEIAGAIIRILTDEVLARKLAMQGKMRVENELSCEKAVEKVKEVANSMG